MIHEERIKTAFGKVKEDTEGIKNEIAFALKRIAKLEEVLTKIALENPDSKSYKKRKK